MSQNVYVLFHHVKTTNKSTIQVYSDMEPAYKGVAAIAGSFSSFLRIRELLEQEDYPELLKVWPEFTNGQEILTVTRTKVLTL